VPRAPAAPRDARRGLRGTHNEETTTMQKRVVLAVALALYTAAGSALADAELVKKHNCVACHANERKVLGPSFKDVAARYGAEKGAAEKLAKKIKEGGVGVWGQMPMPPQPQVSDADALALAKYVLTIK
jgi:cytochrome c